MQPTTNYNESSNLLKLSVAAKAELAKRELARRRILNFVPYDFPLYRPSWHHRILAEVLERVERRELLRVMVLMPPRHGKSELASVQFPPWWIGRNPRGEIIAASYSADLAKEFGRKARNIVHSQEYLNLFPGLRLDEDQQSAGKWNIQIYDEETKNWRYGGSYTALGVGGAATGKGADVFLIDDPIKNRQEAESEVIRKGLWDWYRSTAYTRLSPHGAIVLIQTRWHDDDLAGRLLLEQERGGDRWVVIRLPAIANRDENHRKAGEPLWPDRFNLQKLEEIRGVIGPYEWSALYQQEPITSELQEFRQEWFQERSWDEVRRLDTRKFLTVDTAISEKAEADYTGIVRNFVDRENKWNFAAMRLRINAKQLIDLLFTLDTQDGGYEAAGIEKTIYLKAIQPFLEDEMRKRDHFLNIVELEHQEVNKHTRIRGLVPRYSSRSIFHIQGECRELEEELLRFPRGVHDDVSDAAAYQNQIAEAPEGEEEALVPKVASMK